MKCDYCKKPLHHPKIVHTATGAFHGDCLDKLHAAAEGFGKLMHAFLFVKKPGREERIVQALREGGGSMSVYLKQLAQNIRDREKEKGKKP